MDDSPRVCHAAGAKAVDRQSGASIVPPMNMARVQCFAFSGIEAVPVEVQVQISSGLPAFLVVGLPDKTVGEARERVRAALTSMGLSLIHI